MNEVKCMYVSENERNELVEKYTTIMKQLPISSTVWEKRGEYFRQFSIYSTREIETNAQNTVK